MTALLSDVVSALAHANCKPTQHGNSYVAFCPVHEVDGHGHKPSLSVAAGDKVPVVIHCHAGCAPTEVFKALGIEPDKAGKAGTGTRKRVVATYPYRDASGHVLFEKVRYEPKDFRIRHQDASGAEVWKLPPGIEPPLYRLPDVRAAIAAGEPVYVTEGEKDADRLVAAGLCATTNFDGAAKGTQKAKWRDSYTAALSGADVVLLPDHDEPGTAHMRHVAAALFGKARVRLVELPGLSGAKGDNDLSDWLNKGHTIDDLKALEANAGPENTQRAAYFNAGAEPALNLPTVSPCTHLANSYRIRHYFKGRIWYALGAGWILWTGQFWRPDPTNEGAIATGFVDSLSRRIAAEAGDVTRRASEEADGDRRKALMTQAESLMKWAIQSENERVIASGLKLTKHALLIEYNTLNADPWLFNVQNGTVDLRTGQLRPHNPADLITFIAPVAYDHDATCPIWERFVSEVFGGDLDMVAFIQRGLGWSLTGVVKERALFFLYGDTGKNGKTTMVEAFMKLVGDCGESSYGYGRKVGADTFMRSRNSEDNQRKAATLAGPRFICTSEVDEEHRLNEQLIKDITGGDTLEGRRLYQEAFTFKPQFKPWMYGNHKPEIRGTDDAIWSRVRMVPFEVSFKGREDLDLAGKLEAELSGILNWAIKGCLDWQRHGLQPPAKVQAATAAYRAEMDVFGPFISECCVVHRNAEVWANQLYSAYRAWCVDNGVKEQNQQKFGRYLTANRFNPENAGGRVKRLGLGLRSHHDDHDDNDNHAGNPFTKTPYSDFSEKGHDRHDRHNTPLADDFISHPSPAQPASPPVDAKPGIAPRPTRCEWDRWNDRLVVKCPNPSPNDDGSGCAHCGAVKPAGVEVRP